MVRASESERGKEKEERGRVLTPGVQSRVSSTPSREKGPGAQRSFNYADITVIKPINACHCATTAGPHRLLRPIHNHG